MICPACGAEYDESSKESMLEGGEWIAAGPPSTVEGFQISALYMPLGWAGWLDLVRERLAAEELAQSGDDDELKVFENTRLARSYKRKGQKLAHQLLQERAKTETFALGVVPLGGLLLTQSVDVQGDRLEYQTVAWGYGEESWLVDFGRLYGDPGQAMLWEQLDEIRRRPLPHASGTSMRIAACAIDSGGHHTHEVYSYCRSRAHERVFAVKGDGDPKKPVKGRASMVDVNFKGRVLKHGCQLWFVGTHTAKNLLANRFRMEQAGPGFIHLPPDGLPEDYFEQLTAEERVTLRTARGPVERWVKPYSGVRNEAWDLWVYALFAAHAMDTHRYTEARWKRLAELVAPAQPAAVVVEVVDVVVVVVVVVVVAGTPAP
jgi:phage terminase large subunit GpA-like protein